jgi:GNAT superfamily N-acetyltransferase
MVVHATIPGLTIRAAVPADLSDVLRLTRGLAEYERMLDRFTATEHDLHDLLFSSRPYAFAALAHFQGSAVGLATWYHTIGTFTGRLGLFLEDLFVEPAHRGRGIGLALFRHLATIAQDEGCTTIEWRVLNWNQPSIDFYRQIGAQAITEWQTMELRGPALAALAQGSRNG